MPSLNHDVDSTELRERLEMVIHYLKLLDLPYHTVAADFTPPGWDLTVQELIARLEQAIHKTLDHKSVP